MTKFIIHADDIGLSKDITNHILDSLDNGIVDRTSIIVNGFYSEQAAEELNKRNMLPFLHLNLSEGSPITKSEEIKNKICKNQNLNISFFSSEIRWLFSSKKEKKKLYFALSEEIKKQIEKYKEFFPKNHLIKIDGHENIHMSPLIFYILLKLSGELKISEVRLPREKFRFIFFNLFNVKLYINFIKAFILNFLALIYFTKLRKKNISFEKVFHGVVLSGKMKLKNLKRLFSYYQKNPEEAVTILLHPGYSSEDEENLWNNRKRWKYYNNQERLIEYKLATNSDVKDMMNR